MLAATRTEQKLQMYATRLLLLETEVLAPSQQGPRNFEHTHLVYSKAYVLTNASRRGEWKRTMDTASFSTLSPEAAWNHYEPCYQQVSCNSTLFEAAALLSPIFLLGFLL